MPIYEYRCEACGHAFEAIQKLADDPLTDCPECGEPRLRKLLSAAGFRLKGGGWYETDFKKGDKKRNLHESGGAQSEKKAKPPKDAGSKEKKSAGGAEKK